MSRLSAAGWEPDNPAVRDVVPAILRGNNLVVVVPPAPVYATPALAGLIERRAETGRDVVAIVPPAGLEEWRVLLASLAGDLTPPALLALGPGGAGRRLPAGAGLLVASPATVIALRERSLIDPERIGAVLIGWPELWEDGEALTVALQDLPREVQRVVVTSDPGAIASLIERHAWRATTIGAPVTVPTTATEVLTVAVPWDRRAGILPLLVERLRTDAIAVWTADPSRHQLIRRALAGASIEVQLTTGTPEAASHVIAFDPPSPDQLHALLAAGPVAVLSPPGTEQWLERIAARRTALILSGPLETVNADLARRRRTIEQAISTEPLNEGFLALGPVFEQHDPAAVAAALYRLWIRVPEPTRSPQTRAATASGTRGRVWIGAGKRDELGVRDLVGFLINEVRVDRAAIGRIELRDTFALVEVPEPEAERIAQSISGKTLKKRRLVAKVDRR